MNDKNNDGYVILDNTIVSLDLLEVLHLRDHVCRIKGVCDFDKNNLKLWKVIGIKSKDIKEQNSSIEEDIIQKLRGKVIEHLVHIFKMNWIRKYIWKFHYHHHPATALASTIERVKNEMRGMRWNGGLRMKWKESQGRNGRGSKERNGRRK
ncbi:hypothetical protein GLOIN_2v1518120 [Rhizophagus clarus]|uniref:Uncharacterized protein n=1 Tax=Rhizophagus clarus TaxID=94130 RepID=A0A8H3QDN8_9GLOM|nr:hypothetical protein GLOIN_2v1518120 [Rhizophagus clarus]